MEIRIRGGFIEVDGIQVAQLLPSADEKEMRHIFEVVFDRECDCYD